MIVAEKLSRRFGEALAVDKVSFTVNDGKILSLLGPDGAGKTTTVRMLAGLLSPTSGSVSVQGFDVVKDPIQVRRRVGVLTEAPNLYERLSLNIRASLRINYIMMDNNDE